MSFLIMVNTELQEKKKKSFFSSGTLGKLVAVPDKKTGEVRDTRYLRPPTKLRECTVFSHVCLILSTGGEGLPCDMIHWT